MSQVASDDNDLLVLKINYELQNYDIEGTDYTFRRLNLVLKNSIRGGHSIGIRIQNLKKENLENKKK